MLMVIAAIFELISWLLIVLGVSHGLVISWQSFAVAGLFLAFLHRALGFPSWAWRRGP